MEVVTRPVRSLVDQLTILVKLPAATVYIIVKGVFLIMNTITSECAYLGCIGGLLVQNCDNFILYTFAEFGRMISQWYTMTKVSVQMQHKVVGRTGPDRSQFIIHFVLDYIRCHPWIEIKWYLRLMLKWYFYCFLTRCARAYFIIRICWRCEKINFN